MSSINSYTDETAKGYGSFRELVGAKEVAELIYRQFGSENILNLSFFCSGPGLLESEIIREYELDGGYLSSVNLFDQSKVFVNRARREFSFLRNRCDLRFFHVDLCKDELLVDFSSDVVIISQALQHFVSKDGILNLKLFSLINKVLEKGGLCIFIHSDPKQILAQWPTQVSSVVFESLSDLVNKYITHEKLEECMEMFGFKQSSQQVILFGPYLRRFLNNGEFSEFTHEVREALPDSFSFYHYLKKCGLWSQYWNDFDSKVNSGELERLRLQSELKRLTYGVASIHSYQKQGL